jgi:DNA gyrase subunit A
VPVSSFKKPGNFVLATREGRIKRVNLEEFADVRPSGLIAMSLDEGDQMNWAKYTDGTQDVILVTEQGSSIRFHEDEVRVMGRPAAGVNSIKLNDGDYVVGMDTVCEDTTHVLIVTRNGYGKRTAVEEYRVQGRYGQGILTLARNERTGPIVAMRCVNPKDDILIITEGRIVLRTSLDQIRDTGRIAQGVKLIDLADDDFICGIAIMAREDEVAADADEVASLNGNGNHSENGASVAS